MIGEFEKTILELLITLYERFGWGGVLLMMAFENTTGISPSEITLSLAGWVLLALHDRPAGMVFVGGLYAALGSSLGASISYWIIRLGGRPLVDRGARWMRIDPRVIRLVEKQFQHWGPGVMLFGRLIPGVRNLVTIPAGLARMHYPQYLFYTFLGTYLYCTLIIGIGYTVGHEWYRVQEVLGQLTPYVVYTVLALAILALVSGPFLFRRMKLDAWLALYEEE